MTAIRIGPMDNLDRLLASAPQLNDGWSDPALVRACGFGVTEKPQRGERACLISWKNWATCSTRSMT